MVVNNNNGQQQQWTKTTMDKNKQWSTINNGQQQQWTKNNCQCKYQLTMCGSTWSLSH
jgi:hypothetical protein